MEPTHQDLRERARALPPTKACALFSASLSWEHLDAKSRTHAQRHFLDTLGAAIAGANQHATNTVARALTVAGEASCSITSPIPGRRSNKTGLLNATHLMGTAAHGLELDDGYRPGMMHPGCVVVPVVLLLGARLGSTGPQMLTAMAAGYEIACRISAATHPRARWRGFHPTSAAGVFASAAAAGNLLKLDPKEMEDAFGIAASSSAGLFTFLDGGDVKRLHGGLGGREGLFAALLAREGLGGPPNALESANGYFHSHAGGDPDGSDYKGLDILAAGGFPDELLITQCYLKPYASCRHIHGPLEMLLELRSRHSLTPADVKSIHVGTYAVAAAHGTPGWSEMTTAQMSMPYALSIALARGKATPAQFSETERCDPAVAAFCSKVQTSIDPDCEARYPSLRPARIAVQLNDGQTLEAEVTEPPGEPGRPLNDVTVEEKFLDLTAPVLGTTNSQLLIEQTRVLPSCGDIGEFLKLCIPTTSVQVQSAPAPTH